MTSETLAELEARRITHVRIVCCGAIAAVPWIMLPVRPETPFAAIVGRLRCSRCGRRPDPAEVTPWASWMASGGGSGGP